MKVLLVGNGGREHALAWKLASSPRVSALFAAPGNPGTAQVADNVNIGVGEFDKLIMRHQAVPTAEARSFTSAKAAEEYVRTRGGACVVKAAGLAKGKGVTVAHRTEDAIEAINAIMRDKAFGEAGARVVIEEKLSGPECSILAFVDRKNIYVMESAQDHKAVDDGDTGPMTGGMGAYSPTPLVTDAIMREIERDI